VTIPTGAMLPYPPGWTLIKGDAGTATAALRTPANAFVGYLNLTPRQGKEALANWVSFRVAHNAEEGDRSIRILAADRKLQFRSGPGACVRDSYVTNRGARYVELACLVAGRHAQSVIVGAAPPGSWRRMAPRLERAISAFTT